MGISAATAIFGAGASATAAYIATAFVVNMAISAVVAKIFAPDLPQQAAQQPNPGSRQQLPPSGTNKLPVVYGSAYVGGCVVDMSITTNNQSIYYAIALCEVTNSETGGTPDVLQFGRIYWGGKRVVFHANGYSVIGLTDESTVPALTQAIPLGAMEIYLYRNGSNQPANSSTSAITVMSASTLVYQWDATKTYDNCAFAIVRLSYNSNLGLTGLQSTRIQVINPRDSTGDCITDYMTSTRYGAAIPTSSIDIASMNALKDYSNQLFTYNNYLGVPTTQARFKFNGTLDTNQNIMSNIQQMADCCDCLVKFNEVDATWGVIVQKPTYSVAMDLNDSNLIGAITVNPSDIANSFNQIEAKYPDGTFQDSFGICTLNLFVSNPSLLYPNEPINKQSFTFSLCNNSVQAQYLANRILEGCREDLQVSCEMDFSGLQLEAGDIVTMNNTRYGWVNKLFRVMKLSRLRLCFLGWICCWPEKVGKTGFRRERGRVDLFHP